MGPFPWRCETVGVPSTPPKIAEKYLLVIVSQDNNGKPEEYNSPLVYKTVRTFCATRSFPLIQHPSRSGHGLTLRSAWQFHEWLECIVRTVSGCARNLNTLQRRVGHGHPKRDAVSIESDLHVFKGVWPTGVLGLPRQPLCQP